jgi:hypothetical protein
MSQKNPFFGNHFFDSTNVMISEIYFLGSRWQHLLKAALAPALDYPRSSPLIHENEIIIIIIIK